MGGEEEKGGRGGKMTVRKLMVKGGRDERREGRKG